MVAIQNKPAYINYEHFFEKIKINNNNLRTFCFREKETIEHVLYECEKVQRFLSTVSTCFLKIFYI